jgi:hypothetical protein
MVRARAASDFTCDETQTSVREVREVDSQETLYEATGCGKVAQYACTLTTSADDRPLKRPRPETSCVPAPAASGDGPSSTQGP